MHHLTWFQIYTKKERDKLNTGTGNRNNVLPPVAIKLIMLYDHNSFVKDVRELCIFLNYLISTLTYQYDNNGHLVDVGVEYIDRVRTSQIRLEKWNRHYDAQTNQSLIDDYERCIRYLANMRRLTLRGDTPLLRAISLKKYSTAKAILKQDGVALHHRNNKRETAFSLALSSGNLEIVKALLAYQDPHAITTDTLYAAISNFELNDNTDLNVLRLVIDDDRFLKGRVKFIAEDLAQSLDHRNPEFVLALCRKLKQLPPSEYISKEEIESKNTTRNNVNCN